MDAHRYALARSLRDVTALPSEGPGENAPVTAFSVGISSRYVTEFLTWAEWELYGLGDWMEAVDDEGAFEFERGPQLCGWIAVSPVLRLRG